MKIVVVRASELSGKSIARWAEIQRDNPHLFSAFFRPEFTQSVARVRSDVFVAEIDGGAAYFPFQRNSFGLAGPVGGTVSDYQGLIADADFTCDPAVLVRACGLRSWSFDHVVAAQSMFTPYCTTVTESPVVDVLDGVVVGTPSLHSDHRRKWRKLERDLGRIEVELDADNRFLRDLCLKWKSAQYHRTGKPDLFAQVWMRNLVNVIASARQPEFAGITSVLSAGGQPIAIHFGMRTNAIWHWWFPAYDPQFQRYSPGILLLLQMIAGAANLGIRTIDFGRGDNDYKARFANRSVPLIEGYLTTSYPLQLINRSKVKLRELSQRDKSVAAVLSPVRYIHQWSKIR
jgi:CelD/BcsL family acetyltransferase involved in cellulose biosynthesis